MKYPWDMPNPVSLGRESPYSVHTTESGLLVFYRDAVALFNERDEEYALERERVMPCEAGCVLPGGRIVASQGAELALLASNLEELDTAGGQNEEITVLIALDGGNFLSQDEEGNTTLWEVDQDKLSAVSRWPIECTPLFPGRDGKTVICSEQGRLQERDRKTGTVTRGWPRTAGAVWGVAGPYNAVTIDESGGCWLWDTSAREVLSALAVEFRAVRACFNAQGTGGAVLGESGEVAVFKVVEGGECREFAGPPAPLVSLTFSGQDLVGLDENGGLWRLSEDEPVAVGGCWADWATSCCFCAPDRVYIGTATGSLETFHPDGRRLSPSLQVHQDAVVGVELFGSRLLTIGADATVCRVENPGRDSATPTEIADFEGQSVVDHAFDASSGTLWLGLEDGLVVALTPDGETREVQIEGRRVEEIHSAGAGAALVLTDRGSVRYLQL